MQSIVNLGINAKSAARTLACAGTQVKNKALENIAASLRANAAQIVAANDIDIENGKAAGLSASLLDRLRLNAGRIEGMAAGVDEIALAADPVGNVLWGQVRPNGLKISKVTVPLGVIAVIFEARPNVTSDAAALCLKAGNAVILRGGKEAINSNTAITALMRDAITDAGLPAGCIQLVEDTSRESAAALMKLNGYVDVLIPRGGAGLIRSVVENATVPVIETGVGNCHVYIDRDADLDMAAEIVFNAKTSRPSVCNACETLLVHADVAGEALAKVKSRLDEKNVELRGDKRTCAILPGSIPAAEDDWYREYGDYILAVKVVDSIHEAIDHIARYGSGHSECIVTGSYAASEQFQAQVDAAAVYVNASTRYTDGGEFGFGAEIGISTQKLHARGPLGLMNLLSEKYIVLGSGQVR
ncbi:MAG: glutamate-5-semialdehyde dehydrogenase [Oscillospiraceae bacterium]|nr:glutamate-5-semialdehyde dehydrogenase [Oscillospiraceae bacterium]